MSELKRYRSRNTGKVGLYTEAVAALFPDHELYEPEVEVEAVPTPEPEPEPDHADELATESGGRRAHRSTKEEVAD